MQVTPPERYVNHSQVKPERNLSMECCKLVASFFVVFIHVHFPGDLGGLMDCLGQFAVPMFFMISGYFNYRADSKSILRRIKHIISLIVIGTAVHILWSCISTELAGGSTIAYLRAAIPDPYEIVNFIVLHYHPYAGHLWYLNAIAACYLCFLAYTKFWEEQEIKYQPFYYLCMTLFAICFIFGVVNPTTGAESVVNTRDGWLLGLPMFGLGLFIREYQQQIFRRFQITDRKLILTIIAGILFSVLQWQSTYIGIMPFGTLFEVVALMLFLVSHPEVPVRSKWAENLVRAFGPISTWIYILHLMLSMVYAQVCQPSLSVMLGEKEPWLQPLIVLAMSLAAAIVCTYLEQFIKRLRRKTKNA